MKVQPRDDGRDDLISFQVDIPVAVLEMPAEQMLAEVTKHVVRASKEFMHLLPALSVAYRVYREREAAAAVAATNGGHEGGEPSNA